ncbi:MAG: LacI family DNA-binding transcriptional regulator [Woeseiaceae bacterium]
MRRVTIGEVARRAGVSRKTVSRVVNGEANVSDELRGRVEKVVAQLNYKPDRQARSLRSGKSFHIAFLYGSPSSYYVIGLLEGIRKVCTDHGYQLVPFETEDLGSRLVMTLLEFIERERADGLLMMPPMTDNHQILAALDDEGVPFARITPGSLWPNGVDVVTTDRAAGREMVEHLLELGHRHIGFIAGHPHHLAMAARLDGAQDAIREWTGPPAELIVRQGMNTFDSGLQAAGELLDITPRPTAVFAANDDMAFGVIFEAHERGLRVPDDLSVAGFDDTLLAPHIWPGLTTIRQPVVELAGQATLMLLSRIKGETIERERKLATSFVQRRSTGPVPAHTPTADSDLS